MIETITQFFQITSGLDVELFRIAFITSIVIALFVTYTRGNTPLGILVPGTFLLLIGFPIKLLTVIIIVLLVYLSAIILQKYIFPNTIFATREKLILLVFLSILYSLISYFIFNFTIDIFTAGAIGIAVPAMIADTLTRKFKKESIISFIITFSLTVLFFTILKLFVPNVISLEYKTYLDHLYPTENELSSVSVLVMYSIFAIATVSNFILYRMKKLRSSGLLLGAYLGILVYQPSQILFVAFVIGIAYLILMAVYKFTMLFGFRIFVLSILIVSIIYSFTERLAYLITNGSFHAFLGLHFAGIIVCGILVSEMVQHGKKKTFMASMSMTVVIAISLYVIQVASIYTHTGFTISSLLNKTVVHAVTK